MTEITEAPEAPETTEASAGRGRPRSADTIARDERVFAHIKEHGPKTRKQLADELELPGNEIYLSLYRLSRTEPPHIVRSGSNWSAATADAVDENADAVS
jgi:hypothetical protein